eukprot:506546-Prymnesium_polylepis.1
MRPGCSHTQPLCTSCCPATAPPGRVLPWPHPASGEVLANRVPARRLTPECSSDGCSRACAPRRSEGARVNLRRQHLPPQGDGMEVLGRSRQHHAPKRLSCLSNPTETSGYTPASCAPEQKGVYDGFADVETVLQRVEKMRGQSTANLLGKLRAEEVLNSWELANISDGQWFQMGASIGLVAAIRCVLQEPPESIEEQWQFATSQAAGAGAVMDASLRSSKDPPSEAQGTSRGSTQSVPRHFWGAG